VIVPHLLDLSQLVDALQTVASCLDQRCIEQTRRDGICRNSR